MKKCIPNTPRCVRCMDLGIEDCRYGSVKKSRTGNMLRMGQACTPCRWVTPSGCLKGFVELIRIPFSLLVSGGGKWWAVIYSDLDLELTSPDQKCDAQLPCTTCVNGDRGAECAYEPRQPPLPKLKGAHVLSVPRDNMCGPLSTRVSPFQTPTDGLSFHEPPPLDLSVPARFGHNESASSLSLSVAPSSISVISSLLPPTIPPEPQVPLSLLEAERLQVQISVMTAGDLDMRRFVLE